MAKKGMLASALFGPSSHAAKKTDQWQECCDRLTDCVFEDDVDQFDDWLINFGHTLPESWLESLREISDKRREEIRGENVTDILKTKYDFT